MALGWPWGGLGVALGWPWVACVVSPLFLLSTFSFLLLLERGFGWGQVLVLICHFIFEFPLLDGVSQPEGLCPWRWDGPCGSTTALARQCQSRSGPAGAIGRNFPAVDLFLCGPQAAIDSA